MALPKLFADDVARAQAGAMAERVEAAAETLLARVAELKALAAGLTDTDRTKLTAYLAAVKTDLAARLT